MGCCGSQRRATLKRANLEPAAPQEDEVLIRYNGRGSERSRYGLSTGRRYVFGRRVRVQPVSASDVEGFVTLYIGKGVREFSVVEQEAKEAPSEPVVAEKSVVEAVAPPVEEMVESYLDARQSVADEEVEKASVDATTTAIKKAEAAGVNIADVEGTGTNGRITAKDVDNHLANLEA